MRAGLPAAIFLICLCDLSHASSSSLERSSYEHHLAQGRYFFEQGLKAQALVEFEAASQMPEAKRSAELHFLLAHSYYDLDRVGEALSAIRKARSTASKGDASYEAMGELLTFLESTFTRVTVVGAGEEARLPEPVAPLLDPRLKRIFEQTIDFLKAPVHEEGVVEVFLPVGAYRLGGHIVELRPQQKKRLDLRPSTGARSLAGVYGEGHSSGPPDGLGSLMVQIGVAGLYLQGEGGAWGRFLVGWMCRFAKDRLALRFAGSFGARPIERLQGESNATTPLGLNAGIQLAAGPVLRPGARLALTPWFAWNVSYGRPIEISLPSGYHGPVHYLVHGPDIELLFGFPPRKPAASRGVPVEPVVGLRVFLREHRPLGLEEQDDSRPHLTAGAGVEFGLRVGG